MCPFSQRKPLHIFPVGKPGAKNGQQENDSPRGLSSLVSEIPTINPLLLLTGQATALLVSGPPSVPRSSGVDPWVQRAACETTSPSLFAWPTTWLRLLTPFAPAPPPRPSSVLTL